MTRVLEDNRTIEILVIEGEVRLENSYGSILVFDSEEGIARPYSEPTKTRRDDNFIRAAVGWILEAPGLPEAYMNQLQRYVPAGRDKQGMGSKPMDRASTNSHSQTRPDSTNTLGTDFRKSAEGSMRELTKNIEDLSRLGEKIQMDDRALKETYGGSVKNSYGYMDRSSIGKEFDWQSPNNKPWENQRDSLQRGFQDLHKEYQDLQAESREAIQSYDRMGSNSNERIRGQAASDYKDFQQHYQAIQQHYQAIQQQYQNYQRQYQQQPYLQRGIGR